MVGFFERKRYEPFNLEEEILWLEAELGLSTQDGSG